MKIETTNKQNKLESGLSKLTQTMNKDFEAAHKIKVDHEVKTSQPTKLEKLKRFIGHVAVIDADEIKSDENIRKKLDTTSDEFKILLESISRNGIQQNLIVEFKEDNSAKGYSITCVAGHRRLEAARQLNITSVPCLIKTFKNESEKTEIALAENLLRENLHALDIADGYKKLLDLGWNQEDIQKHFDRNEKTIKYYLKMSNWSLDAKELIRNNSEKFSTRTLMRKFACKKYNNDQELMQSLQQEVNIEKAPRESSDRTSLASKVQSYLETKNYSQEVKNTVWDILLDLQIVKDIPKNLKF